MLPISCPQVLPICQGEHLLLCVLYHGSTIVYSYCGCMKYHHQDRMGATVPQLPIHKPPYTICSELFCLILKIVIWFLLALTTCFFPVFMFYRLATWIGIVHRQQDVVITRITGRVLTLKSSSGYWDVVVIGVVACWMSWSWPVWLLAW